MDLLIDATTKAHNLVVVNLKECNRTSRPTT